MLKFFKYFKGIKIRPSYVYFAHTDTTIPVDKSFLNDVRAVTKIVLYFAALRLKHIFVSSPKNGAIAFVPHNPGPWYNIWQASRLAGFETVSDPSKADYVFIFDDATISEPGRYKFSAPMINADITDISKKHVADVFETVFGYSLSIDPTTHKGPAVQKSDENGLHDGQVVNCPLAPEDVKAGQVYQRLIDSTFSGQTSEDWRIIYAFGEIAVVYHKHKPLDDRFGTHYLSVNVLDPVDVFSPEESELIKNFCDRMQLDFGAIDIMRDKHDGKIYIVDVNKTCMPVMCLPLKEQIACQRKAGQALSRGLGIS